MGQEADLIGFVRIWLRCSLCRDWHHTQKLFALLLLTTARAEVGQGGAFEKDLHMNNQGRTRCRSYLERSWEVVTLTQVKSNLPGAIGRYSDELCYALTSKIKFHGWQNNTFFELYDIISGLSIHVVNHHGVMATVVHHVRMEKAFVNTSTCLDVGDEGWSCFHQIPGYQLLIL